MLMMGLTEPDLRQPDLLRSAIAAGIGLGGARGWFIAVDMDPLWSTVRLPRGGDGFGVAVVMALLLALATVAPLISASHGQDFVPYATAAVALGAAFLSARAATVYLRTRH